MKKKVVLLGDSIRLIGYGTVLPQMLADTFEVWQPEENGRYVQHILRELFDFSAQINSADIVHFNSGEWDICNLFGDGTFTSEETYTAHITRIADILLKKGKTVVFATTTPVKAGNAYNSNDDIRRFNALAVAALAEKNVIINDLYSVVVEDLQGNIREDDSLHLSEQGIENCAKATAEILRNLQ